MVYIFGAYCRTIKISKLIDGSSVLLDCNVCFFLFDNLILLVLAILSYGISYGTEHININFYRTKGYILGYEGFFPFFIISRKCRKCTHGEACHGA